MPQLNLIKPVQQPDDTTELKIMIKDLITLMEV